jgi:glycosyltransferase involved in cell wall biosynthesis
MQERPTVFMLGKPRWHNPWWMSRQHLMARLARRGWSIVYATGPLVYGENRRREWRSAPWSRSLEAISGVEPGRLLVDRPGRWLPSWPRFGAYDRLVLRRYARFLMRASGAKRGGPRIAFVEHPSAWPYLQCLEPCRVVYYVHDAYLRVPGARKRPEWREYEQRIAERADLVIGVARNMLVDLPREIADAAELLPHGVDFDAVVAGERAPCPADLAEIPRPRIGYIGRVTLKTDLATIDAVAKARPDLHWVFVGQPGGWTVKNDAVAGSLLASLRGLDNVHFLGVREQAEIPAYLAHMDVNTIPYRTEDTGYWSATFPTKLFEYLACARPVVSSPLENLGAYASVVDLPETAAEWVAAIDRGVRDGGVGTPEARRTIARANTWDERVDHLERWLLALSAA